MRVLTLPTSDPNGLPGCRIKTRMIFARLSSRSIKGVRSIRSLSARCVESVGRAGIIFQLASCPKKMEHANKETWPTSPLVLFRSFALSRRPLTGSFAVPYRLRHLGKRGVLVTSRPRNTQSCYSACVSLPHSQAACWRGLRRATPGLVFQRRWTQKYCSGARRMRDSRADVKR